MVSPSLKHLYHFATWSDLVIISISVFMFLTVGVAQSLLNLIMATQLDVGPGESLTKTGERLILYLGGYMGGGMFVVFAFASISALYTRHKMMEKWRVEFVKAVLRQDIGWYDVNQAQQLAGRMGESMVHINKAFSVTTYQGIMPLGMVFGALIISFIVNPELAALCGGLAVVLVGPASVVLARTIGARTRLLADAYSTAGGFAAEILGAMRTVASLGLERYAIRTYDDTLAGAQNVAIRTTTKLALAIATITAFVFYACGVAALYARSVITPRMRETAFDYAPSRGFRFCTPAACGWPYDPFAVSQGLGVNFSEALRFGNTTCGVGWEPFRATCASGKGLQSLVGSLIDFLPFLPSNLTRAAFDDAGVTWPCADFDFEMMLVAVNSIIFSFLQLPMVPAAVSSLIKGMSAAHSCLGIILRIPPIDSFSTEGQVLDSISGSIEVKDVVFAYPAAPDFNICNGYSLAIPAGSSCALVGPSGSGKSTIIALLQRFYDPQGGVITLDGVDICTLNLAWLRSRLGLVSQEPVLFEGTVAENIRYGKEGATQGEIEEAAAQANALGFISNDLQEGFATPVGQGGAKLSGGQKQRVAIARALIKKPAILLLDEATSALDNKSEKVVQAALDEILQATRITSIVIAHRLSTIRHSDKIATVRKGVVVEEGTYDELLAIGEGGLFYSLASKQEEHVREDQEHVDGSGGLVTARQGGETSGEEAIVDAQQVREGNEQAVLVEMQPTTAVAALPSTKQTTKTNANAKDKAEEDFPVDPSKRLMAMYAPADKRRLLFGFVFAAGCGAGTGFMGIVIVNSTFPFRDQYDPGALERQVLRWSVASICIGLFIHVFETLYKIGFAVSGEALTRRLRVLTLQQLLHQELGYFDEDENSVGALTEFLAEKVSLVQGLVQDGLQALTVMVSSLVTSIIIAVLLGDWRLLLAYIGGFVPGVAVLVIGQVMTGSQEERYKQQGADEETEMSKSAGAVVGEVVSTIRTVAAFNVEVKFLRKYAANIADERRRNTGWRMLVGSLLMAIGMASTMAIFGFVLYYGFWLIENDPQSFAGSAPAGCPLYKFNIGKMMVPMLSIIGFFQAIGSNAAIAVDAAAAKSAGAALFERVDRVSHRDPFSEAGDRLNDLQGHIVATDLVFAYPTRPDFRACRGFCLKIAAGQVCALVGPSGSGKSTIVALLQRFYDPQGGVITLDGVDICTLNLAWLRSRLGLVSQEPVLFEGTVAENIRHGKEGATQGEIEEAAQAANAHGFITDTLSAGYATQVGLRGGQLSGGQKQRVAIARALIKKPAVMLLDEATSALDTESEHVVQAALDEIMTRQRRTTITIAHRLSTIRNSDVIAVISRGAVAQSGTHEELRATKGLYAELLAARS